MAYLFLDNRGRANVYDKRELVPGGMSVKLDALYENNLINLDVFFTGIQVNRKASRQIRKALDRSFHIFQFGEDSADIVLHGMAIAESQANNTYDTDSMKNFEATDNTTRDAVEKKLKELGEEVFEGDNQWMTTIKNEDGSTTQVPVCEGIAKESKNPDENWATGLFQSVRDMAYTARGAENTYTKVLGWADKSIKTVKQYAISPIASIIPEGVKTIKHLLGMSTPDNMLDTRQVDMKIGTITELNAFFHAFNSGNHSNKIVCRICGILVYGLLDSLSFKSLPKGHGYSFTLRLTGLHFHDGLTKSFYIDPQVLHPAAGSDLSNLIQAGANYGFNAIRTNSSGGNRIV